eukprot:PhF_6_TR26958/c0_g1_i3/m.39313
MSARRLLAFNACYHQWATQTLLGSLDTHFLKLSTANPSVTPDELLRTDVKLYFKSIQGTLNHLYIADTLWYHRVTQGLSSSTPTMSGVEHYWGKTPSDWENYATAAHTRVLLTKQTKLWKALLDPATAPPEFQQGNNLDALTITY